MRLDFGAKCGNYGYGDITITADNKYDANKIFDMILKHLEVEDADGESIEKNENGYIFTRSFSYDFIYGLVGDTQKELRQSFKATKKVMNDIKNGKRLMVG